MSQLSKLKHW